jgi:hypothetical protein
MSDIIGNNEPFIKIPCRYCNNYNREFEGIRCTAFEVIPDEILSGKNPHTTPLKGQGNKIVFTPKIEENV